MDIQTLCSLLNLVPHPEGGFFCETYRSADMLAHETLPERYSSARTCSTAIYYLLTSDSCSRMHRVASDEIFHFYLGDPVNLLELYPDGSSQVHSLGQDIQAGQKLQHIVPHGVWQGSILKPGGHFALLGTTVSPGFDFEDFEIGNREDLLASYPSQQTLITCLT